MLVVSSAMHIMAHYYNYERLARYSPPNRLPEGEQAIVYPAALPFDGGVGVSYIHVTCTINQWFLGI